jgi:probable HAF family extracellular repeat protein
MAFTPVVWNGNERRSLLSYLSNSKYRSIACITVSALIISRHFGIIEPDRIVIGRSHNTNVAGKQSIAGDRAFLWQNGTMTALEIPQGYLAANAMSINNSGEVVGWLLTAGGSTHAAVWENGKAHDIGAFEGGTVSSATCINDEGQVVGSAQHANGDVTAFLWQNGVMHDLGRLPGDVKSRGYQINDLGQVVGSSFTGNVNAYKDSHAFVWDCVHGIRDTTVLLNVPTAEKRKLAGDTCGYCINDRGWIMGDFHQSPRRMFVMMPRR